MNLGKQPLSSMKKLRHEEIKSLVPGFVVGKQRQPSFHIIRLTTTVPGTKAV